MKSLIKKRIKTTPNQINYTALNKSQQLDQEQLKMPFKPFQGKFNSMKQSQLFPGREQSTLSIKQKYNQFEERRFNTQAQTNDIYQSDFQEYEESFEEYQTVQEQNQILGSTINPQIQSQSNQPYDEFQYYSVKEMNLINSKLIENIEFLRYAIQKYKINASKLLKQENQLDKLNQLKNKAIDYTYELSLERQTANKTELSKSQISRIKQASVLMKKQKYKMTKESYRKANPTVFQQQYLSPDSKHQNSELQIVRQQLLCKKRQFYHHKEQIKQLDDKIQFYEQTLDKFQSKLCLVSIQTLERRKKQLQEEISLKKTNLEQIQIGLNLQISNLNNQLTAIEIETLKISQENNSITQKIREHQLTNNLTPKNKPSISGLFRKKFISQANQLKSPIKLPNTPQTPRAISRFYYNPNKNRNSSIFTTNQI